MGIKTKLEPLGGITKKTVKKYTVTVTTNPSNATAYIYYNGSWNTTKSLEVEENSQIQVYVYHSTYGTSSTYTYTITSNKTINFNGTYSTSTNYAYSLDSDITKYGSPTISNAGLMTNISTSNYLKFATDSFSTTSWEVYIKFKYSATTSTYQMLLGQGANSNYLKGCRIGITQNGYLYVASYNGGGTSITNGSISISSGSWHTVKVTWNGSTFYVYVDGSLVTSKSSSKAMSWATSMIFGCETYAATTTTWGRRYPATNCTIDLQNSYIISGGTKVINNQTSNTSYSYYWQSPTVS